MRLAASRIIISLVPAHPRRALGSALTALDVVAAAVILSPAAVGAPTATVRPPVGADSASPATKLRSLETVV